MGCVPPKFYGLPKIHKPDTPLRPIVSSCGSVTYGVAKELAKILKPLVGKSPHQITSTQDFVEQAKQIILEPGECLSFLWCVCLVHLSPNTSCPHYHQGSFWKRTPPSRKELLWKLVTLSSYWEFCLKNTYFSFQDQFYEQVEGAAMGSPVSPIVANLYMEYLEQKALSTAPNPQVLAQVCGWHLYHPQGSQQTRLPSIYQQCWCCYKVYSRGQQGGWVYPLLGHYCQTRGWWYSVHNCVQETHTYWPVFTVGQSPSPLSQI